MGNTTKLLRDGVTRLGPARRKLQAVLSEERRLARTEATCIRQVQHRVGIDRAQVSRTYDLHRLLEVKLS
jgi:hypothetical protein